MFKKIIISVALLIIAGGVGFYFIDKRGLLNETIVTPIDEQSSASNAAPKELPFDRYTVLALGKYPAKASTIMIEETFSDEKNYISYIASFSSEGKKVTAMMNVPKGNGPFPVIVIFRGYVDREEYRTGIGSEKAAGVFANNSFITFAPDFLGYGGSDMPSDNILEERFQTYIVALDALASVAAIEKADVKKIGIWGHSNGGQIALTVLEATQKEYPTVLWAPVSKPFPYSILYYTDEATDRGKLIRRALAEFEKDYNVDLYAITDYFNRIKAPIQLHQGSADDAVPQKWSDELNKELKDNSVDVFYFTYSGADHNLVPSWNTAVSRDVRFFSSN